MWTLLELLPIACQRPFFPRWKRRLMQPINPRIDQPLALWAQKSLDAEFEEGGIRQARRAAMLWLRSYTACHKS